MIGALLLDDEHFASQPQQRIEFRRAELRSVRRRAAMRSEEHTSELQSRQYLVCRLLLEKKKDTAYGRYSPSRHKEWFPGRPRLLEPRRWRSAARARPDRPRRRFRSRPRCAGEWAPRYCPTT